MGRRAAAGRGRPCRTRRNTRPARSIRAAASCPLSSFEPDARIVLRGTLLTPAARAPTVPTGAPCRPGLHDLHLPKRSTHMDTPMLGSQPQAVSGEIFFIVGGDEAAVERITPYLDIMGKLHMYVGGSAMGNRVKLVHNGLVAVTAAAVAEALAVCVQSGVDPYTFYDVVRKGGGMAYGTYFERRAKRIFDGEFSPTFMCELMRKDAGLALALAKASKVPTPILEETKRTYDEAVDSGWGKEDFSAVTHVIETRIGRKLSRS